LKRLIKYKLESLLLIVCLSISTLIFGVEVCKIPSGCQIDEKGVCIDCIEEESEEDILEKQSKEEEEKHERDQFWKNLSLEFFGGYGSSNFTFSGQNNTVIDRPYINEVMYGGFSLGTRLRITPRVSFSLSSFRGGVDSVKVNSDNELQSSLDEDVFTTEMSGDISYTDLTTDFNWNVKQWNWYMGLGIFSLTSDLNYKDLTYGSFKYKIDEQNVFFNSGFNFHFINQSFLGLGLKILPNSTYKSNSTDKKIAQYNSSYSSPMLQLRVSNITFNFGMSI
tara:strand:+ start:324 stop:1160 length:837 start_codon:yes stop_codon:yes gene_type:complete